MRAGSDAPAGLSSKLASREKVAAGLRCLILITVFVMARMQEGGRTAAFELVVSVGAAYVLATTFLPWARFDMRRLTLAMLAVDVILITGLVYTQNGIRSEYYLLYYLPILHASVRLNFRDAVGTCALSGLSYLLVGVLERPSATVTTTVISRVLTFAVSAGLLAGFFLMLSREQRAYQLVTKRYREAIEAKNEFLSRVSHEFRTPLTAIVGFSQLLHDHDKELDPARHQEYLSVIREQSQHLARMIEDMLDMSRIEDGRLVLQQQPAKLSDVIESATMLLDMPDDRDRVEVSVDPGTPPVWADSNEMEQAISRIVYNALEVSKPDGRVSLRVRPQGEEKAEVQVSVHAPGIDPVEGEMALFFGETPRVPDEILATGNGLGLAVARALIEMHEGQIWMDDGQSGPAVNFTLPSASFRTMPDSQEVTVATGNPGRREPAANAAAGPTRGGLPPVGTQVGEGQSGPLGK